MYIIIQIVFIGSVIHIRSSVDEKYRSSLRLQIDFISFIV